MEEITIKIAKTVNVYLYNRDQLTQLLHSLDSEEVYEWVRLSEKYKKTVNMLNQHKLDVEFIEVLLRDVIKNTCHRVILSRSNKGITMFLDQTYSMYETLTSGNKLVLKTKFNKIHAFQVITNLAFLKNIVKVNTDITFPKPSRIDIDINGLVNLIKTTEVYYYLLCGSLCLTKLKNEDEMKYESNKLPEELSTNVKREKTSTIIHDSFINRVLELEHKNTVILNILKPKVSKERYKKLMEFGIKLTDEENELVNSVYSLNKQLMDCPHYTNPKFYYDSTDPNKIINCTKCHQFIICGHRLSRDLEPYFLTVGNMNYCRLCGEHLSTTGINLIYENRKDDNELYGLIYNILKLMKIEGNGRLIIRNVMSVVMNLSGELTDLNSKQFDLLQELNVIILIYACVVSYCKNNKIKTNPTQAIIEQIVRTNAYIINRISYVNINYIKDKFNSLYAIVSEKKFMDVEVLERFDISPHGAPNGELDNYIKHDKFKLRPSGTDINKEFMKNLYYVMDDEIKYNRNYLVPYSYVYNSDGEKTKSCSMGDDKGIKENAIYLLGIYNLYLYYKDYCPVKGIHNFDKSTCTSCGITESIIDNFKNKKTDKYGTEYYTKYKKNKDDITIEESNEVKMKRIKLWNIDFNYITKYATANKLDIKEVNLMGFDSTPFEIKSVNDYPIHNLINKCYILLSKLKKIDMSVEFMLNTKAYRYRGEAVKLHEFALCYFCYLSLF